MGIAPPPGFVLDQPDATAAPAPPPPGFVLDGQAPAQPSAEAPSEPGMMARAGNVALDVLFPHKMIANAVGEQIERGGQAALDFPGQLVDTVKGIPGMVSDALDTTGTHYRTLAHGIGLPVDAAAPEDSDKYIKAVTEMLLTTAGGAAAKGLAGKAADVGRYIGRGFRTVPGAERFLAAEAPHVAAGTAATPVSDLLGPSLTGALAGTAVDVLGPSRLTGTRSEFIDNPVAAGAGVLTAAKVSQNTLNDLLLTNPKWRNLVMSTGGRHPIAAAIGGTLGYLAAKGLELGADGVNEVIDFFSENAPAADEPAPPARGEVMQGPIGGPAMPVARPQPQAALPAPQQYAGGSDFSGPLPSSQQVPPPDAQQILARLLMTG